MSERPKDPEKVRVGRQARRRGKEFENEVAQAFREQGFPDAKRNIQARGAISEGADLIGVPIAAELKRTRAPISRRLDAILDQAIWEAMERMDHRPVAVITRSDGGKPRVYLLLSDFLKILNHDEEKRREENRQSR